MGERENDIEGQPHDEPRTRGEPEQGEDVAREARSVEVIPASPQGDGEGDDRVREGARHKMNPEIGEVGA